MELTEAEQATLDRLLARERAEDERERVAAQKLIEVFAVRGVNVSRHYEHKAPTHQVRIDTEALAAILAALPADWSYSRTGRS